MPQPEYGPELEVYGVDEPQPEEQGPPEIAVPRIRVRSALRRSPHAQQRLAVAIALAEEEVIRAHVSNVTELVTKTVRDTPVDEAIHIYMRVLDVPRRDRRAVAARALARLHEELPPYVLRRFVSRPDPGRVGIVDRLTRRLQGRQRGRLRSQVGRATKRAREEVRQAYLTGADRAVAAMEGLVGPAEAVQLFLEKLDVTADWGERIFHDALLHPGAAAASARPA